ncbi:lipopolysaccharide biosynthesis protein [Mucilaginibacter jinjuensis]|uniref:Oligosaccharide flippase family protein n=1 Tax=Mucilaginibacter jinjuensis TaxID=1176721 RepID=A0ABY7T874_9SPHI|nr:oligosaccharide flippase family protein [Mucilaginibacter jinjuensis]WCT11877.1 oligosaccharide flippase family protein [Mucilaginibacter jinjuensis]
MKLSTNIIANLIGRIWIAGLGMIMVPLYIKFLGIESYGLVGFYGTLIGSLSILDLGLSITLNRELTKAIVEKRDATDIRSLVLTVECIYWLIGLVAAAVIILLAPVIATHWLHAQKIDTGVVTHAVMLMGLVVAFQWPISLYNGGLTGLERQVTDNIIMVTMTTIRSAGVILILWFVSPTINAFFIWQAVTSFLYVFSMRVGLWYYLPKSAVIAKFSRQYLIQIWKFAAGVTGIGVVSFFLTQIDKIVLSKMLPLSDFAYYTLAFTIANCFAMFVVPINIAVFPRLTAFVTAGDKAGLTIEYHRGCRIVASIIFPVGLVLIVFAKEVLLLWVKDPVTVAHSSLLVQIVVAGAVLNSLMVMPFFLMLAYGQTKFTIYQNTIASIILVPLLFWWVHLYGSIGGALVWFSVNVGYILFSIPLIHAGWMKGGLITWYIKDTLIPLLPPLITVSFLKIMLYNYMPHFKMNIISLMFLSLLVLTSALIFMPECRALIKEVMGKFKKQSV